MFNSTRIDLLEREFDKLKDDFEELNDLICKSKDFNNLKIDLIRTRLDKAFKPRIERR